MTQINLPKGSSIPAQMELEKTFLELAEQWRDETATLSSPIKKFKHPAYQKIISMGEPVVPLILREFERPSAHWFEALAVITGEDPVGPNDNFKQAVEAWLRWGRDRGLI